jgi:hypothetical protein
VYSEKESSKMIPILNAFPFCISKSLKEIRLMGGFDIRRIIRSENGSTEEKKSWLFHKKVPLTH